VFRGGRPTSSTPPHSARPTSYVRNNERCYASFWLTRGCRRDKLNDLWAEGAAATEAASVTFVNEEDDEDAPIPANFRYLEHRYEVYVLPGWSVASSAHAVGRSDDCALPANYKRPDLLVGCLCALGECSPNGCWDNEMDDDTRSYVHSTPAYDPHVRTEPPYTPAVPRRFGQGRFKHTSGQQIMYTVVECNNVRRTCTAQAEYSRATELQLRLDMPEPRRAEAAGRAAPDLQD
jgi:hypothetical protein